VTKKIESFDVLAYLRPDGGYVQSGSDFAGITFLDCEPFTEEEYLQAFDNLEIIKANAELEKQQAKALAEAKLAALGLTTDDLRALGL
jgi:hypothetical protein